jgi:hypothetical protein
MERYWSPDGRGFVEVALGDNISLGKNEFYWIGADGAISQIISIRNEYSTLQSLIGICILLNG